MSGVAAEETNLLKLGYRQNLSRGLSTLSCFAFGFTEVGVLVSVSLYFGQALQNGGPVLFIWGFLLTWCMNTIVSYSMAELCSAYPCAGSVYHWSAHTVPERYAPISSYICGWSNFIGNAAGDASFAYGFALMLNASLTACNITPYSTYWTVGVAILTLLLQTMLNSLQIEKIGWFVNLMSFIHGASIIAIIVVLFSLSTTLNSTGKCVYLVPNSYSFSS